MQTNYYKFEHYLSIRTVGTSDHYTTFKILVFNVADVSESEENEGVERIVSVMKDDGHIEKRDRD